MAPAGTRPHPVTSGPPGEHGAPAAVGLAAWREVFAEERAPRTSLNRPVGADRKLALVRSGLDLAKQIAHAHDAKVNDVVLRCW